MIVVTGGAGFIGSAFLWRLNREGIDDVLVVDRLGSDCKWKNLAKRRFNTTIHKNDLFRWLEEERGRHDIEAVVHLGACSATTERDADYLIDNNLNYSIRLWRFCSLYEIPFLYASSAATYGDGECGFNDDDELVPKLRALNPYGFSKQKFDDWVLREPRTPPFWAGFKFFNVFGPQEYHKGAQASVIWRFLPELRETNAIRLFKSYRSGIADGEQRRDFVYVKDVVDVLWHFLRSNTRGRSGIYNVGSGQAQSFNAVANAMFKALGSSSARLEYKEMPEGLRGQYQYFTEASLTKLRTRGAYKAPMTPLEEAVGDYVGRYLIADDQYL